MQCPNCEFQNMPGSGRCARCGTSLALATAAIDVHPPRATRLSRALPHFWMFRQNWGNMVARLSAPLGRVFEQFHDTHFELPILVRTIVPGWPQYYRGDRPRAILFLWAYLAFLVPGLLLTGTFTGSLLLGLAFGIHVTSIADALVGMFDTIRDRLAFTILAGLALLGLVYFPTGWAISRVATPVQINQDMGQLARGDVLWYSRWFTPEPGDMVLYEIPPLSAGGRLATGQQANFVIQGQRINRILAMSGQTVAWQKGQLLVDGEPSPWQPATNPARDVKAFTVPDDRVFIYAEGVVPAGAQLNHEIWRRVCFVRPDMIQGHVYFRSIPFWRISIIH